MKVLAATINKGYKMFSIMCDFPTVLLAELRTHRILTQGAAYEHLEIDDLNLSANSARAIPTDKYLQKILDNPFIPQWTSKKKGMSGGEVSDETSNDANIEWLQILSRNFTKDNFRYNHYYDQTIEDKYKELIRLGIHKQNANRLLAPYAYTTCILTGTEWDNFFDLRCPKYVHPEVHPTNPPKLIDTTEYKSKKEYIKNYSFLGDKLTDLYFNNINKSTAQPEFQIIAEQIYDLYCETKWSNNKYHIPFDSDIDNLIQNFMSNGGDMTTIYDIDSNDLDNEYHKLMMKISASMCAKLSYDTQNNEDTLEKHLERAKHLLQSKHYEPFSHQAVAMNDYEYDKFYKSFVVKLDDKQVVKHELGWCYNIRGFKSQRYIIENL